MAERCATLGSLSHEDVQAARKWLEVNLAPSAVGIQGMSMGGMNWCVFLSPHIGSTLSIAFTASQRRSLT